MAEEYEDLVLVEDVGESVVEDEPEVAIKLFDIVNDISNHGRLVEGFVEANKKMPDAYSPYVINNIFASYKETIMMAREANKYWEIPPEAHWRFWRYGVDKKKRFSKMFKKLPEETPIDLLAQYFGCTVKEMRKHLYAFTKEELDGLLRKLQPEKYAMLDAKKTRKKS